MSKFILTFFSNGFFFKYNIHLEVEIKFKKKQEYTNNESLKRNSGVRIHLY